MIELEYHFNEITFPKEEVTILLGRNSVITSSGGFPVQGNYHHQKDATRGKLQYSE